MAREHGVEILLRFARLASEGGSHDTILPLLGDALVEHVGADAVAVLEIDREGAARLVPSPHLPRELETLAVESDVIGEELGRQLLRACSGRFAHARSRPLVSGGGLFGTAVLFFAEKEKQVDLALAEGLVDLAAIALEGRSKLDKLARSHAELRASQEALARAEKLRALGEMAAGVSHDLKNILSPLSLNLQLLQRSIAANRPEDAGDAVDQMKQVLKRGLETIERLRDYSRQAPEGRAEDVDLDKLAGEAAAIARPRMASTGRVAKIVFELGAPPHVRGRSGEIVSALVNLIVNAIDAVEKRGTITIRTGATKDASWVSVSDDGPGIPPELQRRVFEPFFTTKGEAGTGLGLAMVYASMRRLGGSVDLQTAPGEGTTFTLSFPQAPR